MKHERVAQIFNRCFAASHATVMIGGAAEPLYLPAGESGRAELHYREDYAASALHEAAHWCIAGRARRRLTDFGYAYTPPPRSKTEQRRFFAAERNVQALESLFAEAAGVAFTISADNLSAAVDEFAAALSCAQTEWRERLERSRAPRAARFISSLREG